MKKFLNYITAALFLSLLVFASCGGGDGDDGPDEDPLDIAAAVFSGKQATITANGVKPPAGATGTLDWSALTVTLTGTASGGTYTTTGSADNTVWPASGNWTFNNDSPTQLLRDGDVVVNITASSTSLVLQFNIDTQSARTSVIEGDWEFTFDLAQ